jgi:hypothetical protein
MSTIRLNSSSLVLNSSSVSFLIAATATPTIGTLSCTTVGGVHFIDVPVTNEDASSALIEVSQSSIFSSILASETVAGGGSTEFSISGYSNPPGSQTFYARATATGKAVSATRTRTQNIPGCFGL